LNGSINLLRKNRDSPLRFLAVSFDRRRRLVEKRSPPIEMSLIWVNSFVSCPARDPLADRPVVTNLAYSTSAGTAVSTAGFGAQTYFVALTAAGAFTSTGGVRWTSGKAVTATTTNGNLSPFNWIQVVKVSPGEQLSAVSNDRVAGTLVVVELTN
jgi:hypothetical protein